MKIAWQITFAALSLACFMSFAWAIKAHFLQEEDRPQLPVGMRLIGVIGLISMIMQMAAIAMLPLVNTLLALCSVGLFLVSLSLFWWAISVSRIHRLTIAFSLDTPRLLLLSGPYRLIRHPFYSAYMIFWTAGLLAGDRWWLIPTVLVMFALYLRAARNEEAKFLSSALGADYSKYKNSTGMFFPRF